MSRASCYIDGLQRVSQGANFAPPSYTFGLHVPISQPYVSVLLSINFRIRKIHPHRHRSAGKVAMARTNSQERLAFKVSRAAPLSNCSRSGYCQPSYVVCTGLQNQINEKFKIFKQGQTVVDLVSTPSPHSLVPKAYLRKGYAPGSWSQV